LNIQIRTKEFVNDFDKYTHNNPEKTKKLDRNAAKMQKTDHNCQKYNKMHINKKRKLYKNTKTTRQKERNVLQYIHNKRAFTKVTI
jgi:hypothetical protein